MCEELTCLEKGQGLLHRSECNSCGKRRNLIHGELLDWLVIQHSESSIGQLKLGGVKVNHWWCSWYLGSHSRLGWFRLGQILRLMGLELVRQDQLNLWGVHVGKCFQRLPRSPTCHSLTGLILAQRLNNQFGTAVNLGLRHTMQRQQRSQDSVRVDRPSTPTPWLFNMILGRTPSNELPFAPNLIVMDFSICRGQTGLAKHGINERNCSSSTGMINKGSASAGNDHSFHAQGL